MHEAVERGGVYVPGNNFPVNNIYSNYNALAAVGVIRQQVAVLFTLLPAVCLQIKALLFLHTY